MLLIYPPAAKPGEPPAGIARLAAALQAHEISCTTLDANLEGFLHLLQSQNSHSASDAWTRRAIKNRAANLSTLRDPKTYRSYDKYSRAVRDVNRALESTGKEFGVLLGLADYHHQLLSPVRSQDLLTAAGQPERNPFYSYFSQRLPELIEDDSRNQTKAAHLVGISLNYLSQALCAFAIIGFIKKEYPAVKIVLGGGLVSSWMKRPGWKNPFGGLVDYLISGPGEAPLLDLHGVSLTNKKHRPPDYETLPFQEYLSPGFVLPYSASTGCYWNKCSFCPETAEDNPYSPVPVEQARADLLSLVDATKPILVHFLDNAVSPALMRSLADKPIGAPWYGFARISRELTDLDYCVALKRSGCVMLKLGLESGDQSVLDRMQKGIDLETASLVLLNLKKAGIASYVYLLFGTPHETLNEARRTLEFVVKHHYAISFLNLAIFNMPVCGKEAEEFAVEQFYEGDLSLYTGFKHPQGWDRKLVRQFLDTEFKKHPAIAAILRRDPPIFTSNHAPFFTQQ